MSFALEREENNQRKKSERQKKRRMYVLGIYRSARFVFFNIIYLDSDID